MTVRFAGVPLYNVFPHPSQHPTESDIVFTPRKLSRPYDVITRLAPLTPQPHGLFSSAGNKAQTAFLA